MKSHFMLTYLVRSGKTMSLRCANLFTYRGWGEVGRGGAGRGGVPLVLVQQPKQMGLSV